MLNSCVAYEKKSAASGIPDAVKAAARKRNAASGIPRCCEKHGKKEERRKRHT